MSAIVGVTLLPKAVRHIMATEYLAQDPRNNTLAAAALSHADPEMVALHYARGTAAPELEIWRRVISRYTTRVDR